MFEEEKQRLVENSEMSGEEPTEYLVEWQKVFGDFFLVVFSFFFFFPFMAEHTFSSPLLPPFI